MVVLKSIACLRYQSCETEDWEQSKAARWLEELRELAIDHLPGYEAAPWGWDRRKA